MLPRYDHHHTTHRVKDHLTQARLKKQIGEAYNLVNPQLHNVEQQIAAQARAFDPKVEGYIAYACESKGKRIRPALALLAGGATGKITPSHIDLAVIMELIHLATLVHDDIIDGAELRRSQATANAKWGNGLSVLLGDVLFAHALKLAAGFDDSLICRRIAEAATDVCSGEILQTQRRFDLTLSIADYFKIIEMKTAALFAVSAELGGVVSGASPDVVKALYTYGLKLGTAYQIYDDCLDIAGSEKSAGKTLGSDLRKGKLTLPVLTVLKETDDATRETLHKLILEGNEADMLTVAQMTNDLGGLKSAIDTTLDTIEEAVRALDILPDGSHKKAMTDVGTYLAALVSDFV